MFPTSVKHWLELKMGQVQRPILNAKRCRKMKYDKEKDDKELEYVKPDYETLANEEYEEDKPFGLEDMVFDEETGEYEYPNEDSFRMDRLQEKFLEKVRDEPEGDSQ